MHVVPARVADPLGLRRVGQRGLLGDGQGVDVGAECDPDPRHRRTHLGDEPGASKSTDREARSFEAVGDQARGAQLGPPQLGVLVQVAAEGDECVGMLIDGAHDGVEGVALCHEDKSLPRR